MSIVVTQSNTKNNTQSVSQTAQQYQQYMRYYQQLQTIYAYNAQQYENAYRATQYPPYRYLANYHNDMAIVYGTLAKLYSYLYSVNYQLEQLLNQDFSNSADQTLTYSKTYGGLAGQLNSALSLVSSLLTQNSPLTDASKEISNLIQYAQQNKLDASAYRQLQSELQKFQSSLQDTKSNIENSIKQYQNLSKWYGYLATAFGSLQKVSDNTPINQAISYYQNALNAFENAYQFARQNGIQDNISQAYIVYLKGFIPYLQNIASAPQSAEIKLPENDTNALKRALPEMIKATDQTLNANVNGFLQLYNAYQNLQQLKNVDTQTQQALLQNLNDIMVTQSQNIAIIVAKANYLRLVSSVSSSLPTVADSDKTKDIKTVLDNLKKVKKTYEELLRQIEAFDVFNYYYKLSSLTQNSSANNFIINNYQSRQVFEYVQEINNDVSQMSDSIKKNIQYIDYLIQGYSVLEKINSLQAPTPPQPPRKSDNTTDMISYYRALVAYLSSGENTQNSLATYLTQIANLYESAIPYFEKANSVNQDDKMAEQIQNMKQTTKALKDISDVIRTYLAPGINHVAGAMLALYGVSNANYQTTQQIDNAINNLKRFASDPGYLTTAIQKLQSYQNVPGLSGLVSNLIALASGIKNNYSQQLIPVINNIISFLNGQKYVVKATNVLQQLQNQAQNDLKALNDYLNSGNFKNVPPAVDFSTYNKLTGDIYNILTEAQNKNSLPQEVIAQLQSIYYNAQTIVNTVKIQDDRAILAYDQNYINSNMTQINNLLQSITVSANETIAKALNYAQNARQYAIDYQNRFNDLLANLQAMKYNLEQMANSTQTLIKSIGSSQSPQAQEQLQQLQKQYNQLKTEVQQLDNIIKQLTNDQDSVNKMVEKINNMVNHLQTAYNRTHGGILQYMLNTILTGLMNVVNGVNEVLNQVNSAITSRIGGTLGQIIAGVVDFAIFTLASVLTFGFLPAIIIGLQIGFGLALGVGVFGQSVPEYFINLGKSFVDTPEGITMTVLSIAGIAFGAVGARGLLPKTNTLLGKIVYGAKLFFDPSDVLKRLANWKVTFASTIDSTKTVDLNKLGASNVTDIAEDLSNINKSVRLVYRQVNADVLTNKTAEVYNLTKEVLYVKDVVDGVLQKTIEKHAININPATDVLTQINTKQGTKFVTFGIDLTREKPTITVDSYDVNLASFSSMKTEIKYLSGAKAEIKSFIETPETKTIIRGEVTQNNDLFSADFYKITARGGLENVLSTEEKGIGVRIVKVIEGVASKLLDAFNKLIDKARTYAQKLFILGVDVSPIVSLARKYQEKLRSGEIKSAEAKDVIERLNNITDVFGFREGGMPTILDRLYKSAKKSGDPEVTKFVQDIAKDFYNVDLLTKGEQYLKGEISFEEFKNYVSKRLQQSIDLGLTKLRFEMHNLPSNARTAVEEVMKSVPGNLEQAVKLKQVIDFLHDNSGLFKNVEPNKLVNAISDYLYSNEFKSFNELRNYLFMKSGINTLLKSPSVKIPSKTEVTPKGTEQKQTPPSFTTNSSSSGQQTVLQEPERQAVQKQTVRFQFFSKEETEVKQTPSEQKTVLQPTNEQQTPLNTTGEEFSLPQTANVRIPRSSLNSTGEIPKPQETQLLQKAEQQVEQKSVSTPVSKSEKTNIQTTEKTAPQTTEAQQTSTGEAPKPQERQQTSDTEKINTQTSQTQQEQTPPQTTPQQTTTKDIKEELGKVLKIDNDAVLDKMVKSAVDTGKRLGVIADEKDLTPTKAMSLFKLTLFLRALEKLSEDELNRVLLRSGIARDIEDVLNAYKSGTEPSITSLQRVLNYVNKNVTIIGDTRFIELTPEQLGELKLSENLITNDKTSLKRFFSRLQGINNKLAREILTYLSALLGANINKDNIEAFIDDLDDIQLSKVINALKEIMSNITNGTVVEINSYQINIQPTDTVITNTEIASAEYSTEGYALSTPLTSPQISYTIPAIKSTTVLNTPPISPPPNTNDIKNNKNNTKKPQLTPLKTPMTNPYESESMARGTVNEYRLLI